MKDKSFFSSPADLRQKLNNTVIRYKNEPYLCGADGTHELLRLTPLVKATEAFNIDPDNPDLDYSSPPLGFVNYPQQCYYAGRIPARRSVQGLSEGSIVMYDLNGINVGMRTDFFAGKRMYDCITNNYPSFTTIFRKALNTTSNSEYSQAFARAFAIRKMSNNLITLYHKFTAIGEYDRDKENFNLIPTYQNPVLTTLLRPYGVPINESQH